MYVRAGGLPGRPEGWLVDTRAGVRACGRACVSACLDASQCHSQMTNSRTSNAGIMFTLALHSLGLGAAHVGMEAHCSTVFAGGVPSLDSGAHPNSALGPTLSTWGAPKVA